MRIYIDESGTNSDHWLVIGMLFVPDHGPLHSALCEVKDKIGYFNKSPKRNATYKETHLSEFRSNRDVQVAENWVDVFLTYDCFFRSVVIDWSIWNGKYFGDAFEPDSLKRRRAYKKWAEMLIQPELRNSEGVPLFYHAKLYLDKLTAMRGYDVLDHLQSRFTGNYHGESPFIDSFQHTDSWRDANQCLQLCDLLTGSIYQKLQPSTNEFKLASSQNWHPSAWSDWTGDFGVNLPRRRCDNGFRSSASGFGDRLNSLEDDAGINRRLGRRRAQKASPDGLAVIGDQVKPKPSASAPGSTAIISTSSGHATRII